MHTRLIFTAALLSVAFAGCSVIPPSLVGDRSTVELTSIDGSTALRPALPHRVYRFVDENTADIILTDLSIEDLTGDAGLPPTGTVMHVQLFIRPRPGRTPIAHTACSATVRCAVLAHGQVGMYGGAGFLIPDDTPGGKSFGGTISRAPVRLLRATEAFEDQLGISEADVGFTAGRDDETVGRWITLMDRLALVGREIEYTEAPPPPMTADEAPAATDEITP